jgi:hypothetical protein
VPAAPGPAEADALLARLVADLPPADAARALSLLASRAAVRLHTLARVASAAHKGQPAWPAWAGLQNAARTLTLQTSTCRDLAAKLPAAED